MKTLTKTEYTQGIPVFGHDKAMQLAQGGFNLDKTGLAVDAIIPAGSALAYNEATRVATLLKTAAATAAATSTATSYSVGKNNNFVVGDIVTLGGASSTISSIDSTNANFDVLTLAATIGAANVGDPIYASAAVAASGALPAVTVKGLLYKDTKIDSYPLVDVVIRHANVYARRIPALPASIRNTMSNIIFSETY